MRTKRLLLAALVSLPLAAAGLSYGTTIVGTDKPQGAEGTVCPLTGEEIACPRCCPGK